MLHFLAKFGRKPWASSIVPTLGLIGTSGYVAFHCFGDDVTRKLLGAQTSSGSREEIGEHLKKLVTEVHDDIKDVFNLPTLPDTGIFNTSNSVPIKLFCSSTLDPLTFGLTETKTGILIGLPIHYNYQKIDDIPQSIFELRKLNLFKSSSVKKEEDSKDSEETGPQIQISSLGDDGDTRKNYIESLILSEKAKKFSVAREMFIGDSYRPLMIAISAFGSFNLTLASSRLGVNVFGMKNAHISKRLLVYMFTATAGMLFFNTTSDAINCYYTTRADQRALKINESYREGAEEYFSKLLKRNKALRNIVEELKYVYDDEGNPKEGWLRHKHVPITERLAMVRDRKEEQ